jgi:hypothetical protein
MVSRVRARVPGYRARRSLSGCAKRPISQADGRSSHVGEGGCEGIGASAHPAAGAAPMQRSARASLKESVRLHRQAGYREPSFYLDCRGCRRIRVEHDKGRILPASCCGIVDSPWQHAAPRAHRALCVSTHRSPISSPSFRASSRRLASKARSRPPRANRADVLYDRSDG